MKHKFKSIGSRPFGSRTVVGMICILAALAICFGIAPAVNRFSNSTTEIVRVRQTVVRGSLISESDVEIVSVGSYHLPDGVVKEKDSVVGKYAAVDLFAGDYLLPGKLTSDVSTASDLLGTLGGGRKAISVSIESFAMGLSGKLETGDIISVIVYSGQESAAFTPPELQYVRVITSTTSQGVDKADISDGKQPVTVTLMVNQAQAELLAQYEKTASMHFALEFRGDAAEAQRYLDVQDSYFSGGEG